MQLAQVEKIYQALQKPPAPDLYKKHEGDGRFFANEYDRREYLSNLKMQDIEEALSWLDDRKNIGVSERARMRRVIGQFRFATRDSLKLLEQSIGLGERIIAPAPPTLSLPEVVVDLPLDPVPASSLGGPDIVALPPERKRSTPRATTSSGRTQQLVPTELPPTPPTGDPLFQRLRDGGHQVTMDGDRYRIWLNGNTVSLTSLHAQLVANMSSLGTYHLDSNQSLETNYDPHRKNLIIRVSTEANPPHLTLLVNEMGQVTALPLPEGWADKARTLLDPSHVRSLTRKEQDLIHHISLYCQRVLSKKQ